MLNIYRNADEGTGGSAPIPGGDGDKLQNPIEKSATVTRDEYERLLTQKKRAQEKLEAFEADAKKRNESELAEKQEYKKLYESAKAEADEWKGKFSGLDKDVTETRKLNSLLTKLPGKVDPAYWDLIDLDKVAVDPETGKIDEASVAKVAKEFEAKHSRLIDRPGSKLPQDAARGGVGTLKYDEWLKLPLAEKQARLKDVMDSEK